jgi:hypothetical protein
VTRELPQLEATGDRARTEGRFARYGAMPPRLAKALESARDAPTRFANNHLRVAARQIVPPRPLS